MNQPQAINLLNSLTVELQDPGKSVEEVLIKAATVRNLAPAQLVKLAQVYNAAASLAYTTDREEEKRGATPYIVDTTALSEQYQQHRKPESKKARVKSAAAPAVPTVNAHRFPSQPKPEPEVVVKSAAAADPEPPTVAELRAEMTELDNEIFRHQIAERALLKKAAGVFSAQRSPEVFTEMVQDAAALVGQESAYGLVKDAAVRVIAEDGRRLFRCWSPPEATAIPEDSRRVKVDRYGMTKIAAQIHETRTTIGILQEMMAERSEAMNLRLQKNAAGPFSPEAIQAGAETSSLNQPPNFGEPARAAPPPDVHTYTRELAAKASPTARGGALLSDFGAAARETGDLIPEENEFLSSILSLFDTNGRKVQQARDLAAADTRRIGELQQLIVADPVLASAEPKAVLEAYKTVRMANPAILDDPGSLAFVLREAVQYAGVPPQMRGEMIKQRGEQARAVTAEQAIGAQRYAPGTAAVKQPAR